METSRVCYTKHLRYFLCLSLRTLNPYQYHSHTLHTLAPCSPQLVKKQYLCNSSCGLSSSWFLKHPTLLSAGIYRSSSSYRSLVSSNVGLIKACYGGTFRFFCASSDGKSMIVDEGNEHKEVNTSDFDSFLGELKQNDVRAVKSTSSSPDIQKKKSVYPPERISEIISIIKSNDDDFEIKLSLIAKKLYIRSATELFEALNSEEVSGLRFFSWIRRTNPTLRRSAEFCSLIINNCGWLNDYGTMVSLLREFESEKICLTKEAFGFLTQFGFTNASAMESVGGVIQLLNEVGGSCRSSGICAMIQLFCTLGLFDMARFVMEVTERTVSRYNILIREMCRRSRIEEAFDVIEEMRTTGCCADAKTYNHVLGRLCKTDRLDEACNLLEAMKEKGTPPDALSFEILIDFLSRLGKFDRAYQYFDQMVSQGIQPRFTVHAAIIKALMKAKQYEEAYKYVNGSSLKDPVSSPMIYTLLANLHQKNGDLISARNIILEMMDKGLKPNFNVYMDVVSRLQRSGKASSAKDLRNGYSRFTLGTHTQNSN